MIFGVQGFWAMDISEPLEDTKPIDIISVKMISEAGNIMPSCELDIMLKEKSKLHKLEQGKPLRISMGISPDNMVTGNFVIFKRIKLIEKDDRIILRLILTQQSINYSVSTAIGTIKEKSKNLIASMAGEGGLSFTSNIPGDTVDKMNWVRHNISPRVFVNKLWTHSKLPNPMDVMLIGITPDGKLHCRSLEQTKAGAGVGKWAFIPDPDSPSNGFTKIFYSQNLNYKSNTGAIDYLGGYSQTRIVHNVDDKSTVALSAKKAPTVAQTQKDESINVPMRFSNVSLHSSDNMHSDWYSRENYNIRSLLKLNAHTVKVICESQCFPVDVTDIAFLYDKTTDTGGLWLVKKVCHRISQNHYSMIVTLCRDNPNEVN